MNGGNILGIVRQSGRPLQDAIVGLDWIRGGGQRLNFYSADADGFTDRIGMLRRVTPLLPTPLATVSTATDEIGVFVLSFQWSGTDLGIAMSNPQCQIYVLVDEPIGNGRMVQRLRGRYITNMIRSVSVSQASGGLIANPTQLGDQLGIGADIHTILRRVRVPMIGRTVASASPDMYALLAGYRINL
jgi:hypothetical protein